MASLGRTAADSHDVIEVRGAREPGAARGE